MLGGLASLRFFYKPGSWLGWRRGMPFKLHWIGVLSLLLTTAAPSWAQQTPTQPTKPTTTHGPDSPKPLPPKQLEEALRLLLRADSVGRAFRRTGTESQGLVMDQTISKLGRDFYDLFYGSFEAPSGLENFTVVLVERQARANNAVVALIVNDTELFELPLTPRADMMEESAMAAVGAAVDFLLQAQSISRQLELGRKMAPEVF